MTQRQRSNLNWFGLYVPKRNDRPLWVMKRPPGYALPSLTRVVEYPCCKSLAGRTIAFDDLSRPRCEVNQVVRIVEVTQPKIVFELVGHQISMSVCEIRHFKHFLGPASQVSEDLAHGAFGGLSEVPDFVQVWVIEPSTPLGFVEIQRMTSHSSPCSRLDWGNPVYEHRQAYDPARAASSASTTSVAPRTSMTFRGVLPPRKALGESSHSRVTEGVHSMLARATT